MEVGGLWGWRLGGVVPARAVGLGDKREGLDLLSICRRALALVGVGVVSVGWGRCGGGSHGAVVGVAGESSEEAGLA